MSKSGFPVEDPVTSYWQLPPHHIANHRTTPDLPNSADYVIIGSGITGAVIAQKLLERDARASILMIEARTAASAASGRNGGHCRGGWWHRFPCHVEKYGEEEAVKIDNLEQANVQAMADFVRLHNIQCDFKPVETAEVFKTKQMFDKALGAVKFRQAFRQRLPESGIAINHRVIQGKEAQLAFGIPGVIGATTYLAYTQNPYLLVCNMLELSLARGLNLQTHTIVRKIAKQADGWQVITQRGSVQAKNVILATNAYTNVLYPDLAVTGFLVPSRRQVAAIRPGDKAGAIPALKRSCALSDYNGGDYFLVREEGLQGAGEMLYGGGEHIDKGTGCTDDSKIDHNIAEYLHHAAADYIGQDDWGKEGEVVNDWVGITCYTPDSFPLVGEAPGQPGLWVSVGMNGHGMAFAYKCAEALVCMMDSEPDWLPKSFRLARAFEKTNETFQSLVAKE
ncbi:FAD dependent oxidoreductase superfamily [Fusarium sporotrichioides]|uniref:FAD dependent oxidoreductase superfamily n=1 Tax=Fusarium sporotrichioides TaxID=5514 RepID=A0A395SFX3_FUSSP|nr:FAD dependent oxidoreductase superfamily [Fusarium sporotrichioides]